MPCFSALRAAFEASASSVVGVAMEFVAIYTSLSLSNVNNATWRLPAIRLATSLFLPQHSQTDVIQGNSEITPQCIKYQHFLIHKG
jgi:hypothetical protein